jgi:hypothetical protein
MALNVLSRPSRGDRHTPHTKRAKTGGRKKGTKNKRTELIERQAQLEVPNRTGQKLAVDWLRDTAELAAQLMRHSRPLDEEGKERKDGDRNEFLRWAKLLLDAAVPLAQYESPKLSDVAIAPPVQEERTEVRVSIFDHDGHKVHECVDGKRVPLSEDGREEEVDE